MVFKTLEPGRHACLITLTAAFLFFSISACTVKRTPVPSGFVPKIAAPDPRAKAYGKRLYQKLCKDYELESDSQKQETLAEVFYQLTKAADIDHLSWHVYLLNGPDIVDIRAVHGNYIFVWSGLLDAVENVDELAGLLAYELSHNLAHHTDPVQFTTASNLLFNIAEIATSVGLMVASQGAVAIGGSGWLQVAYVEIADLDSLDRNYSEVDEREAANIALLILSRSPYSPQALLDFWKRAAREEASQDKYQKLSRGMSPQARSVILEQLLFQYPLWESE